MKLKENELKIFYKGELSQELDEVLENALKLFGYRRWASGYDLVDDVRDLAFDK